MAIIAFTSPPKKNAVFVIHNGYKEYLAYCLRFAKRSGNIVILVSDKESLERLTPYYDFGVDDNIVLPDYEKFKSQYKHMSTNEEGFELLCFKRFFLMKVIAEQYSLNNFFLIDSDIALLENISTLSERFSEDHISASLSIQKSAYSDSAWAASPHFSFWTLESISGFILFLSALYLEKIDTLLEKYNYHLSNGLAGGICDMTALFLWQVKVTGHINNAIIGNIDGWLIDHNVNISTNYSDEQFSMVPLYNIKKIKFNKQFVAYSKSLAAYIPVLALHFQGSGKVYMKPFYEKKRLTFAVALLSNPSQFFRSIIPLPIKNLLRSLFIRIKLR